MYANRPVILILVLVTAGLLVACGRDAGDAAVEPPAEVEAIEGSALSRIRLSERAAQRLGIETAAVEERTIGGESRLTVPYSAILYDANGDTWAYVAAEDLVFVREPLVVDRIDDDRVLLAEGPEPGTMVVTVGVAELFGTETGVGGGGH
jgi:hypothetical protein